MASGKEKFGAFIRRKREALVPKLGLRKSAGIIGVSPTYLSKVERDEFPPPAEDKIRAIAEILDLNVDELLARAGKVSSELTQMIVERPRDMAIAIRGTYSMSEEELAEHTKLMVQKMKSRKIPDIK